MKAFLGEDFLLNNKIALELYHNTAAKMPIIDYHNHLPPDQIAQNKQFQNISKAWLDGDHYKWRAMRANGINETFITGNASDKDKFLKWAETVPYTLRNPLYHWTHLELKNYFDIDVLLNPTSAEEIYATTKTLLSQPKRSCQGLLQMKNVESLCTTDDPIDNLEYHQSIAKSNCKTKVFPTFRPEKSLLLDDLNYLNKLASLAKIQIINCDSFLEAIANRINYFHENGCRLSDISFEAIPVCSNKKDAEINFKKYLNGKKLLDSEKKNIQAYLLTEICKLYHNKGWTQQFHIGVIRNTNTRAKLTLGANTGFDTISDTLHIHAFIKLLDDLEKTDQLAKTIIYNLNPRDNSLFATAIGNFQGNNIPGKIQLGSGWWFLDQKNGIENQINTLSNMGLLSRFVGMLTDSRSFLSFSRHEYFRRILCNLIGRDVINGELPNDKLLLKTLIENICYNNAKNYLKL